MPDLVPTTDAAGFLEVSSIARGFSVVDSMTKKARVTIIWAKPVEPGKFIVLFRGRFEEVEESFRDAERTAGALLIDSLLLPYAHPLLFASVGQPGVSPAGESIGIVETRTVASCIRTADAALKAASVGVLGLHIELGLGGKAYFVVTGNLDDVETVRDTATELGGADIVEIAVLAHPHPEARGYIL